MDKAIIFGVYNFVSFHMCKTLLTKGIEVYGIHIEHESQIQFLEEKRLEIGRNANFVEEFLTEWKPEENYDATNATMFFSLYDLFMLKKENVLQKKETLHLIKSYVEENMKMIFILPIQILNNPYQLEAEKVLREFIETLNPNEQNTHYIYLPSIYGPWQEKTFLFQQAIMSKYTEGDLALLDREWIEDTIYIEDAVDKVFDIIEKGKYGRYLVESGKSKHWNQCAAYLNINEQSIKMTRNRSLKVDDGISITTVNRVTPISESLTEQAEHVRRLNDSALW